MSRLLITVPDLIEISTAVVSISLWSHIHILGNCNRDEMSQVSASAEKLPLPGRTIKLIQEYLVKIRKEMTEWVRYHFRTIFLSRGSDYDLYCLFSRTVWHPNGTINRKQTALALLNSPRLSDLQKYRLSCTYCLKEEIEQKWPVLFEHNAFDRADRNLLLNYPLIRYWNCYCRNALDEMPMTEGMSLDSFMFQHELVDSWSAKEYFFDRMNVEEKMRYAVAMVEKAKKFPWQREMLLKLNETQRIQLYVERPAQVMANYVTHDSVEDALSVWFIIRELINAEQFVTIVRELCKANCDVSFVIEIWRSASSELQHRLLSSANDESFTAFWCHCTRIYEFETYKRLLDTSEDIRKVIREKDIFRTYCERLINGDEIRLLHRVLNICFPSNEELTQFKHNHIHSTSWFHEYCEGLLETDSIYIFHDFQQLREFCFCDNEEFIEFGKAFTKLDIFSVYCKDVIRDAPFYGLRSSPLSSLKLSELLDVLLPRTEDLSQFKQNFAEKIYTVDFFNKLMNRFVAVEGRFRELLELFPQPTIELKRFKQRLTNEGFFLDHSTALIKKCRLKRLHDRLNFFFDTPKQSESFRLNLVNDRNFLSDCKIAVSMVRFSVSELQILMDLMTFDSTALLPVATRDSLKKFKKETIFSPPCISILRDLVENNRFNDVKKLCNGFLVLERDKRALRLNLFDNPGKIVTKCLFEYDESACESWLKWWFSNKQMLQKCKREISLDTVFEDILKKCAFQTYDDSGEISNFILKEDFDLSALNRFLKWYFESANEAKEYKLRKIDEYESIETMKALMKKRPRASYFDKLTSFFFENDAKEIAKFKKKHKGERIAGMVNYICSWLVRYRISISSE